MVSKLIDAILGQRLMVVFLAVLLLVGGLYAFKALNIEAYPDPSPPTIEVIAQNPGWSAEEMERQITVPIETQLNSMVLKMARTGDHTRTGELPKTLCRGQ